MTLLDPHILSVAPVHSGGWDWDRIELVAFLAGVISLLVACLMLLRGNAKDRRSDAVRMMERERRLERIVLDHENRLREAIERTEEQVRSSTGKEVHDRLETMLEAVKRGFSHLDDRMVSMEKRQEEGHGEIMRGLDVAMSEIRRAGLVTVRLMLDRFGLAHVLEDLKWSLEGSGKLRVGLVLQGISPGMGRDQQVALYQVLHDAVDDVLAHRDTDHISISLTRSPGAFGLRLKGNGSSGTNDDERKRLLARVARMHGTVEIGTPADGGLVLDVVLPDDLTSR